MPPPRNILVLLLLVMILATTTKLQQTTVDALDASRWNIDDVVATHDGKYITLQYGGINAAIASTNMLATLYDDATCQNCFSGFGGDGSSVDGATINPTYGKRGRIIEDKPEFANMTMAVTQPAGTRENPTPDKSATLSVTTVPKIMFQNDNFTTIDPNGDTCDIDFCVRFGIWETIGGVATEINFQELTVKMKVNMLNDFSVENIVVAPKDRSNTNSDIEYNVVAALCPESLVYLNQRQPQSFKQGDIVGVCIKPNEDGMTDGLNLFSIDEFSWVRNDLGEGKDDIIQNSVTTDTRTGVQTVDPLSIITTVSPQEKRVDSVLFAAFYQSRGAIVATGVATMKFPTARRLQVHDEHDIDRALQETKEDVIVPFDLSAPVAAADDGDGPALVLSGGHSICVNNKGRITAVLLLVGAAVVAVL